MPDVEQHGYRVYPLVDHVADKVMATFQHYGDRQRPSTRYKDLVDLVSIITGASIEAGPQLLALAAEAHRRSVATPAKFEIPAGRSGSGYAAEAARSLLPVATTLDAALAVVSPCLDPLPAGTARGIWNPNAGT